MSVLTSAQLELPNEILDPWLGKVKFGSTIATLSASEPMKFGKGQYMSFTIGEAEYVGEGTNKGPSNIVPTVKKTAPFKFQKTVRWTDEVKYADEDEQLGRSSRSSCRFSRLSRAHWISVCTTASTPPAALRSQR